MITNEGVKLIHGNCLEVLKEMPDNSVDSIVTDPPYGLLFMGKKWDYDVPEQAIWEECLRVLKPGGHLLAFAGTRTQHRMAVRIEDAGFEMRDMVTFLYDTNETAQALIESLSPEQLKLLDATFGRDSMLAWGYGSGFPKSLDVSKAIDKMDAAHARRERQLRFTEWMRSTGLTSAEINRITDTNMGGHYTTAASQPAVATSEHFEKLRPHFGVDVPEWVEQLVDERAVESENFKRREVVGKKTSGIANHEEGPRHTIGASKSIEVNITTAYTDAARKWQGCGTALKPALEPITVARKPFKGTVAANVLAHGTGAMNIDGCRVGPPIPHQPGGLHRGSGSTVGSFTGTTEFEREAHGRWPANLIHDGSHETTELLGAAARFFYCAKASKKDRDEGLDCFDAKYAPRDNGFSNKISGSNLPRANIHPTVKPTDLMAYLCRLVTPPGGVVLDPFMGSGSTGKAAVREGFRFIGIEMDADYLEIAEARIAHEAGKQTEK